jgi:hypothetical protein
MLTAVVIAKIWTRPALFSVWLPGASSAGNLLSLLYRSRSSKDLPFHSKLITPQVPRALPESLNFIPTVSSVTARHILDDQ